MNGHNGELLILNSNLDLSLEIETQLSHLENLRKSCEQHLTRNL